MSGKVILVGAGPGDPGLLTVKGRRALETAEVVVYDRLVSPAVMALLPSGAQRIDVGKEPSHHAVPQSEINALLIREAQAGHRVVRLKGGDPFVFGRGGEEMEELADAGVDFEEIPGVTSAVAAAAYAGIPVTHRAYASSLHIISARAGENAPTDIPFAALVKAGGTLVFVMGAAALEKVAAGLLEAGMDPGTPAAVVENGTLPEQRQCIASLAELPETARAMHIHSPALIAVGGVCALGKKLNWFDRLPLRGMRVLVTRPKDRAGTLVDRLRDLGADVTAYPCIATVPIAPCPQMEQALENPQEKYGWIAFTSPVGVDIFWQHWEARGRDARALAGLRLAVIGPGTAARLKQRGIAPDLIPAVSDAAHLGAELASLAERRVLLLRAEEASPELPAALEKAGIPFDDIAIYRTDRRSPDTGMIRAQLENGQFPYAFFTSASTVQGFVGAMGSGVPLNKTTALCIGQHTAAVARRYGIPVEIADRATVDDLVRLAVRVYRKNINHNIKNN